MSEPSSIEDDKSGLIVDLEMTFSVKISPDPVPVLMIGTKVVPSINTSAVRARSGLIFFNSSSGTLTDVSYSNETLEVSLTIELGVEDILGTKVSINGASLSVSVFGIVRDSTFSLASIVDTKSMLLVVVSTLAVIVDGNSVMRSDMTGLCWVIILSICPSFASVIDTSDIPMSLPLMIVDSSLFGRSSANVVTCELMWLISVTSSPLAVMG